MIAIQYQDYLDIVKNLQNVKNKKNVDQSLNSLERIMNKIKRENQTMNDGRD